MNFGATYLGDNRTRFRLWAPSQPRVTVEIDGRPLPMTRQSDGWFEAEGRCGPGASYLYRLSTDEAVPDPASRAQADDVHGPSLVVDPGSYRWRHPEWTGRPWPETVLYELHVGTYGGFAGVAADLDRLAGLGITAVELMPISDFPGTRNWGYDGVLPYAPDRAYGTPDELRALVDSAHERRLMMFLDVVYNHFGPDGNYLGLYAPQFFRDDIKTPWGAAIDFRQPAVRRYFIENALYWLTEYRFDGLRFDAVHAIADRQWLDEMAAEIRRTVTGRHVHLVLEHDGNEASHLRHGYDAQWNDDAHHVLHALLTGESDGYYSDYAQAPAKQLARCLAEGFVYQGEPSEHAGGKRRGEPSGSLPPLAFVDFLQNHDQIGNRALGERLAELVEARALQAAQSLLLLSPHVPMLFMGEEWGTAIPFQYFCDFHGDLGQAVREGRAREFAGFFANPKAAVPDPLAETTFTRSKLDWGEKDRAPHDRWLARSRVLLRLRAEQLAPRLAAGRSRSEGAEALGPRAVRAAWRLGDGSRLTLLACLGPDGLERVEQPKGRIVHASAADVGPALERGTLPAWSVAWFLEEA